MRYFQRLVLFDFAVDIFRKNQTDCLIVSNYKALCSPVCSVLELSSRIKMALWLTRRKLMNPRSNVGGSFEDVTPLRSYNST